MNNLLEPFYNPDRLQSVCLTFDVDWAPDFVLEELLGELDCYHLKATIFATHVSEVLKNSALTEIAIHPNFMAGSSHGNSVDEVLATMKSWFPAAKGMRSHGLWQSSNMLRQLSQYGIVYDSNLLMYDLPCLQAFNTFYDVVRIPYIWSDASHLLDGRQFSIDSLSLMSPGQKVLDIHPMLWYLNSQSGDSYRDMKRKYPILTDLTREQAEEFVNPGQGVRSLLREVAEYIQGNAIATYKLAEFHQAFLTQVNQSDDARQNHSCPPYSFTER